MIWEPLPSTFGHSEAPAAPHVGPCPPGQQPKASPRTGDVVGGTALSLANAEMPSLQKSSPWGVGTVEFKHP